MTSRPSLPAILPIPSRQLRRLLLASGTVLFLAGCSTTLETFPDTARILNKGDYFERTPLPGLSGYQEAAQRRVKTLLAQPLTLPAAMEIAMLNTSKLQRHYQAQQIWNAGFVETLADITDKDAAKGAAAVEWRAAQLTLLKPVNNRQRYDFVADYIDIGADFIETAEEVRKSYYTAVAAQQRFDMLSQAVTATQAMAELANAQYKAGTANRRSQALQHAVHAETVKALADARQELVAAREDLNRRLGLWGEDIAWTSPKTLPDLPTAKPAFARLEEYALGNRFDVLAERKSWGLWHTAVEVRSEVRENLAAMQTAYETARYQRDTVLPLATTILDGTQREYSGMLLGVYDLLADIRGEIEAGRDYIERLRDFWIAYAELEQSVGGRLPPVDPSAAELSTTLPSSTGLATEQDSAS